MKNITSIITIIIVTLIVLLGILFFKDNSGRSENNTIRQQLEDAQDENKNLQEEIDKLEQISQKNIIEVEDEVLSQEETINIGFESNTMVVNIPNLEWNGSDYFIQYSPKKVPKTRGVLNATYEAFFTNQVSGESGGVGVTSTDYYGMYYDSVSLENSVASVKLIGTYRPAGSITLLEVRSEINAVAFQFDSVEIIQVYLNDELFDWCITDESNGESGCPETPRYWIDSK